MVILSLASAMRHSTFVGAVCRAARFGRTGVVLSAITTGLIEVRRTGASVRSRAVVSWGPRPRAARRCWCRVSSKPAGEQGLTGLRAWGGRGWLRCGRRGESGADGGGAATGGPRCARVDRRRTREHGRLTCRYAARGSSRLRNRCAGGRAAKGVWAPRGGGSSCVARPCPGGSAAATCAAEGDPDSVVVCPELMCCLAVSTSRPGPSALSRGARTPPGTPPTGGRCGATTEPLLGSSTGAKGWGEPHCWVSEGGLEPPRPLIGH